MRARQFWLSLRFEQKSHIVKGDCEVDVLSTEELLF